MIKTPLIRPLSNNGSTLYVFQSANNDIAKSFGGNNGIDVSFSTFALLNIQDFKVPLIKHNNPQIKGIWGQFSNDSDLIGNGAFDLAQIFQNYVLNLESSIINNKNYVDTSKLSTEKIFWKFLKEMGAIRYEGAIQDKDVLNSVTRYKEENETVTSNRSYSKVVKYLGNVSISNNVSKKGEGYLETYLYLRANEGTTPCLFKSEEDDNYKQSSFYYHSNPDKILGRANESPNGLSINAYYDKVNDSNFDLYKNGQIDTYWFPNNNDGINNAYFTDMVFGDVANDEILLENTTTSEMVTIQRNRLDGVEIDWDVENYPQKSLLTYTPTNISDLSVLGNSTDFEYNVVLLYYDKKENNTITRNLYGVVFVDTPTPISGGNGFYIPRFEKIKGDDLVGKSGNSISQRISIRTDSTVENVGIVTDTSSDNQLGIEIYLKSAESLSSAAKTLSESFVTFDSKEKELVSLSTTLKGYIKENEILKKRVNQLEENLTQNALVFGNLNQLLNNLKGLDIRLRSIETGTLSSIVPDLSIIQPGVGIGADRSVKGRVYMNLTHQGYNVYNEGINKQWSLLPTNKTFEFTIKPLQNYFRIYDSNPYTLNGNVTINLVEEVNKQKWENGQLIKVVFSSLVNLDSYNILFNLKKQNGTTYNILTINSDDISGKASFEFVMLDNTINDMGVETHQLQ